MSELIEYQQDIISLISLLNKLLKVINHSDPTAAELKHTLYEKYKEKLTSISRDLKRYYHWNEFHNYLVTFVDSDLQNNRAIMKKLLKDFEAEFVTKHALNELKPPDLATIQKQRRARQIVKEVKQQRQQEERYTEEKIMRMVKDTQKQRRASSDLQRIIDAINKIGPSKIENKISEFIPIKRKQ